MKLTKIPIPILVSLVCITMLIATIPVSAASDLSFPITEQHCTAIIEKISGTPITTDQYLSIVWPEVYKKMSPADKTKLSAVSKAWALTEGERTAGSLLITSAHDDPVKYDERNTLIDVLNGLDITYGSFMPLVWSELY